MILPCLVRRTPAPQHGCASYVLLLAKSKGRWDKGNGGILRVSCQSRRDQEEQTCPGRRPRTRAETAPRTGAWRPRAEFAALHAARARPQTADLTRQAARRTGREGTFSPAVRGFAWRQARSRGHAKTHLPPLLLAVARNLARLRAWFGGAPRPPTRVSPVAALFLEAA